MPSMEWDGVPRAADQLGGEHAADAFAVSLREQRGFVLSGPTSCGKSRALAALGIPEINADLGERRGGHPYAVRTTERPVGVRVEHMNVTDPEQVLAELRVR